MTSSLLLVEKLIPLWLTHVFHIIVQCGYQASGDYQASPVWQCRECKHHCVKFRIKYVSSLCWFTLLTAKTTPPSLQVRLIFTIFPRSEKTHKTNRKKEVAVYILPEIKGGVSTRDFVARYIILYVTWILSVYLPRQESGLLSSQDPATVSYTGLGEWANSCDMNKSFWHFLYFNSGWNCRSWHKKALEDHAAQTRRFCFCGIFS